MGTRSVFSEKEWKRIDFQYPEKALQEGIINALIHRDYSRFNSHLTISSFQDSFVIANSGKLPSEIKISDLKKNHRSFPTNPDIAHIIFLMGYIDKLGRGTMKIIEECKAAGLKEPKWTNRDEEVILTFYSPIVNTTNAIDRTSYKFLENLSLEDAANDAVDDAVDDAVNDALSDTVRNRLKYILKLIYINDSVTLKFLIDTLDSSRATIQRDFLILSSSHLIDRKGSDKYREYTLGDALKTKIDVLKNKP
jgi:ATP-dependent DNA helicase RecG